MANELQSLSNLNHGFKQANRIAMLSIFGLIAVSLVCIFLIFKLNQDVVKNKLVVVANEYGTYQIANKEAQMKAHIKNFHKLFYNIDQFNWSNNVKSSLYLIDNKNGKDLYDAYKSNGFFKRIRENNMSVGVDIDSIYLNLIDSENKTYEAVFHGKQIKRAGDYIQKMRLVTQMKIYPVANSDNNPFGYMIYDYQIINNTEIITKDIKSIDMKDEVQTETTKNE
jgi:hypothetical protein